MTNSYITDVRRFGGPKPFHDKNGQRRHLRHEQDFSPDNVITDGNGHVISMPLLSRKPCFGRPERFYRGIAGAGAWVNSDGETIVNDTQCDTCFARSPGVFEACLKVADERVSSHSSIAIAIEEWIETCHAKQVIGRKQFYGPLWLAVLESIIASGGWTNVNDDQVKLDDLSRADEKRKKRNAASKQKRAQDKAAKNSPQPTITSDYLDSLDDECAQRAEHLKRLRGLSARSPRHKFWIDSLSDEVCERVAHVWAELELDRKVVRAPSNMEIARRLIAKHPAYARWDEMSLAARIGEDRKKRLSKLEDDTAGEPLWDSWSYKAP